MMTKCARTIGRMGRALAGAAMVLLLAASASAQTPAPAAAPPDPNTGALTFTGGLDVPTKYVFRGIVQEADSKLTLFPYGDLGISFYSGEGALKSASVNFGVWNALLTGSSGLDGDTDKLHYEEDFYTTLTLGFDKGFSLATTYTAYTSPNGMFGTVQELMFKVSKAHMLAPYGTHRLRARWPGRWRVERGRLPRIGRGTELVSGRREGDLCRPREVRAQPRRLLRARRP